MRVIRYGVWVKTVPAKFEPVLEGFCFESESKRLTKNERHLLILRLIRHCFETSKPVTRQDEMAKKVVGAAEEIKIIKVHKRASTDWRISADGIQIRVDYDMVGDCPEEFLEVKYEF